ncbi:MAG: hypothetical protein ABF273_03025 [Wenyingzhuangia sp.]|uniref:hypothetical protein n=1 Tax=Wenyingzhuangia sp. TaxID=1964193 RepID=UPI00321B2578
MCKILSLIFYLILLITFQGQTQSLEKDYELIVSEFISCVATKNVHKIKKIISYPLTREYPLPQVNNEKEFILRFEEIFDIHLYNKIIRSNFEKDWEVIGSRGIMLDNGSIWLDYDGKLLLINDLSEKEKIKRRELIEKNKSLLHKSLQNFKKPVLEIKTAEFLIRIDQLDSGFRYASWPARSSMKEKPSLVLVNGGIFPQGSMGDIHFKFKNKNYTYVCEKIILGDWDLPPAVLKVYKDNKLILEQTGRIQDPNKKN